MQEDFHYYATYAAAYLAGYSHEESLDICYSAQLVDLCSAAFLSGIKAPKKAATTQLQLELMDARDDIVGLQDITRIWASFHFLPYDLYAVKPHRPKVYMNKYRLICAPDGALVKDTVELAKDGPLQHVGIAMHVLADTWAHRYFAGTPSLVINNIDGGFFEIIRENGVDTERKVKLRHNPTAPDDPETSTYTNTLYQSWESHVMNLGHGRAGHLPDYSFARYRYLPAWGEYREVIKDNPGDYYNAFCQMVYAMRYIRGDIDEFRLKTYDTEKTAPYEERIKEILGRRQLIASDDWKSFGEELSGRTIDDFDRNRYQEEYMTAGKNEKDGTYIGRFINAAMKHKGMVTKSIFDSGNILAGFSIPKRSKK